MNERDGQIAERSQNLRGVASTNPRATFAEGNIPDVMELIFDTPVTTVEFEETKRTGLGRRERGQEINTLCSARLSLGEACP